MKKTTLTFFLFFLISLSSFSQSTSLGINGGIGHTWNTNIPFNYENKYLIFKTFGVSALRTTKFNFAYSADLNYSFEGSKMTMQDRDESPSTLDMYARLQYLRLPLKGYYLFGKSSSSIRAKVFLGPTLGYLLHAYDIGDITIPNSSFHDHYEQTTTTLYRRFDFGLQGGVGLNFRLSDKATLSTDLNYYSGFPNSWWSVRRNRNASINASVLWNISKK